MAAAYRRAHESYLAERDAIEPLGTTFSAGGMPDRVKCLHVLIAHSLAKGPGLNPLGDEAVALLAAEPAMAPLCGGPGDRGEPARRYRLRYQLDSAVDRRFEQTGELRDVHRETRIVRLGQGVDATGQFAPDAIARTRAALADYAALLRFHGAERVRMVATSAARDVSNRDVFFAMTADVLGAVLPARSPRSSPEPRKPELSFRGAVGELDSAGAPFVVVDLGGGSTEIVLGGDSVIASYSADIGCVRLTERCLHSDPPTAEEVEAARQVVRERLDVALGVVPVEGARTWIGLAGTMTTLSALAHNMTAYDAAAIHLSRVGR